MNATTWRVALAVLPLTLAAACSTTAARPSEMNWKTLPLRKGESPAPTIEHDQLVLDGRAVWSKRIYSLPRIVECEFQAAGNGTNDAFYVAFVPSDADINVQPSDYIAVRVERTGAVSAWQSTGSVPTHLIPPSSVTPPQNGIYRLSIDARVDGTTLQVNDKTFKCPDVKVPYRRFHIELRAFPPPSKWLVRDVEVR